MFAMLTKLTFNQFLRKAEIVGAGIAVAATATYIAGTEARKLLRTNK